jgi:hypothetical protein
VVDEWRARDFFTTSGPHAGETPRSSPHRCGTNPPLVRFRADR